ncbi:MAG: peptidoglycan recognition family protein [Clostridiales bacterium]
MKLTQCFLTENNCFKSGRRQQVKAIMIHSIGENQPWLRQYIGSSQGEFGDAPWNTAQPGGDNVCFHAFIGKDAQGIVRCCQTLPWEMIGWHSGSGCLGYAQNANNNGYIGLAVCGDALDDAVYFEAVYREIIELCAYLCCQYQLNPLTDILSHGEGYAQGIASAHQDPRPWFYHPGQSMDDLRRDIQGVLAARDVCHSHEKEIIQNHCQLDNPVAVFAYIDQFVYAYGLYQKWASSYEK